MVAAPDEIVDLLAGFVLFADLPRPQLEEVSHSLDAVGPICASKRA